MNIASLFASMGFKVDESPLEQINSKLEGLKSRLEFLGAAEVIRGVYELTERYSHFSEELGTAATAAGLTVEALQKIQYAAGLAGVSSDEVAGGLARITRALYDARTGNEEAVKLFAKAGISMAQVNSFATGKEAMLAFADALQKIHDPVAKQALVVDLLGRGSRNMVEFLSSGREEIEKFGDQAESAGAIISTKTIAALRDMEDSLSTFWRIAKAFAATVAGELAPAIAGTAKAFAQLYAANRQVITLQVKAWIENLLGGFGYLTGVVLGMTKDFLSFADAHPVLTHNIGLLVEALGGLSIALLGIGWGIGKVKEALGLMAVPWGLVIKFASRFWFWLGTLIARFGILIVEVFPAVGEALFAFGAALTALPITWAVVGFAALVLGIQALWAMCHGKDFKDTWIGKLLNKAWDTGKSVVSSLADAFGFGDDGGKPKADAKPKGFTMDQLATDVLDTSQGQNKFDAYINGLEAAEGKLQQMRDKAAASPDAAVAPLVAAAAPKGDVTITSNVTVNVDGNGPPAQWAQNIAAEIDKANKRSLREAKQALTGVQTQ